MAVIEILRRLALKWANSRGAIHHGEPIALRLRCSVDETPATGNAGAPMPDSLAAFWRDASGARLFEDAAYGQWGLVLLSPDVAAERSRQFFEDRRQQARVGDLVVGEFLGDQELLLVRCDRESNDFGSVLVALPLDARKDWHSAGPDLEAFLEAYEQAEGAKFWERNGDS